jgi:hypothetical protein
MRLFTVTSFYYSGDWVRGKSKWDQLLPSRHRWHYAIGHNYGILLGRSPLQPEWLIRSGRYTSVVETPPEDRKVHHSLQGRKHHIGVLFVREVIFATKYKFLFSARLSRHILLNGETKPHFRTINRTAATSTKLRHVHLTMSQNLLRNSPTLFSNLNLDLFSNTPI